MAETKCLAVVGSGQMGSGIAQLGAMHGLHVWLLDTDPVALSRASKAISSSLQRFVSKGQLSQVRKLGFPSLMMILLCFFWVLLTFVLMGVEVLLRWLFPVKQLAFWQLAGVLCIYVLMNWIFVLFLLFVFSYVLKFNIGEKRWSKWIKIVLMMNTCL